MMVLEKRVLINVTENVSSANHVSDVEILVWCEIPLLVLVKAW